MIGLLLVIGGAALLMALAVEGAEYTIRLQERRKDRNR